MVTLTLLQLAWVPLWLRGRLQRAVVYEAVLAVMRAGLEAGGVQP